MAAAWGRALQQPGASTAVGLSEAGAFSSLGKGIGAVWSRALQQSREGLQQSALDSVHFSSCDRHKQSKVLQ